VVTVAKADHDDVWRVESFVRAHSSLSVHTLTAYSSDVRLFAEWVARSGVTSPADVNRTLVRRYVAYLSTRDFARRSIARKAAAIRRYFVWAVGEGLVAADPTIGLHVAGGSGRLPRVLDGRELGQLLDGPAASPPGASAATTLCSRSSTAPDCASRSCVGSSCSRCGCTNKR
jgi:site-specific recombinase XerD